MTDRNNFTEPAADPSDLLGLLYDVMEEAERYEERIQGTERLHDRELAGFLRELRDETRRRADQAEKLLAQRLANGGVQ
jgi:trans-2-enoyl-CoA reductase